MNFFDRFFLKIFLFAAPVMQKLNVNMDHLRAILVAKLTMDNRRPAAFQQMKMSRKGLLMTLKRYSISVETSITPSTQLKMVEKQSRMSFQAEFSPYAARFLPRKVFQRPCDKKNGRLLD